MNKAKKVFFIMFIVLCGGLLCLARTFGAMLVQEEIKSSIDAMYHRAHPFLYYNETWEVDIPEENAHITYRYSDIFWMDGERYSIVKFDSRPDEFLQSFSNEKSNIDWDRFEFALEHLVEHGLDESKVVILDENFIYYSKDNGDTPRDILFLLYDESLNTLYIVESFI